MALFCQVLRFFMNKSPDSGQGANKCPARAKIQDRDQFALLYFI